VGLIEARKRGRRRKYDGFEMGTKDAFVACTFHGKDLKHFHNEKYLS
jgi:hypothetical protein